jgi:hypothetical protein
MTFNLPVILLFALLGGGSVAAADVVYTHIESLYRYNSFATPFIDVYSLIFVGPIFFGTSLVGVLLLKLVTYVTSYAGKIALLNAIIVQLPAIIWNFFNILSAIPFDRPSYYHAIIIESIILFPIAVLILSVLYSAVARIQQTSERHKSVLDESL